VQVHEPREVVVADLGNEDAVREVARDVPLRSRERDLVDPRVQPLELRVVHGGHGRVRLRAKRFGADGCSRRSNRFELEPVQDDHKLPSTERINNKF